MHPNDIDVVNILIYQAIFFLLDTRQENRFPYNLVLTTPNIRPLVDWSVSPTSFFAFKIFHLLAIRNAVASRSSKKLLLAFNISPPIILILLI